MVEKKRTKNLRVILSLFFLGFISQSAAASVSITDLRPGEDIFSYITRRTGGFSQVLYQQLVGAATPYKEGDEKIGVSAADESSRTSAQQLIANTTIQAFQDHPLYEDQLQKLLWSSIDRTQYGKVSGWTVGQLKSYLLTQPESAIKGVVSGLNSDVIADVVKLMSNEEIVTVSQKIFNPLPGSKIGSKGYMGARIQPNSPTDNPEDVRWQVFSAWSYGVGDTMLGTNPVSSKPDLVNGVELELRDILKTFKTSDGKDLTNVMPWTVLAHIKTQAQVEAANPGSTSFLFQSIAGNDSTNKVFDISTEDLIGFAKSRKGRYGLYLETGQGSEFTNGQAHGVDMMTLEARKHGLARVLKTMMPKTADGAEPWLAVNDVAGFIGPEVFRNGGQLLRVVLEDTLMGKLHGLTMGLDVCTVYHAKVPYKDPPTSVTADISTKTDLSLPEVMTEVMKANPAYLMALPTPNDPMLSYLTTPFQQHVLMRHLFGYKVNDEMWKFFQDLQVIDKKGNPTEHFGDPIWVYYKYRLAKGDTRPKSEIYADGKKAMQAVISRDVPIAYGHGKNPWDLNPAVEAEFKQVYERAKLSPYAEFDSKFIKSIPDAISLHTESKNREDYIRDPSSGEKLSLESKAVLDRLKAARKTPVDVQIVISDGLNANAVTSRGHLKPFLDELRSQLKAQGLNVARENIVVTNGRVRAGYKIGEQLFGSDSKEMKTVIHIIGERPGTKHDNYSVYSASAPSDIWEQPGKMDHDQVKVVAGISDTAFRPRQAALQVAEALLDAEKQNEQTLKRLCLTRALQK